MVDNDGLPTRKKTNPLDPNRLSRSTPAVDKLCIDNDDMKLKKLQTPCNLSPPSRLSALIGSENGKVYPVSEPSSRMSSAQFYKKRMTQCVVEIPANQLKKLKESDLGSYHRETKHFCDTTTMHGPKRVYRGKQCSLLFWTLMFIASILFLCLQVYTLVNMYVSKPTVSQVSFQINKGVEFPVITICPFNPVKKSLINQLNSTGDFPEALLSYLLETNVEAPALYSSSNMEDILEGEKLFDEYKKHHPEFNLYSFFKDYGFTCSDMMRWCTFGGRKFDCCSVAKSVLTTIGKCQRIDIRSSGLEWLQKQTAAGANAGLQLIIDSQQDEQFTESSRVVSPLFETGFRYYIHDNVTVPYLASEGISVSPGMRVYSALTTNKYVLLDEDNWGSCINDWPEGYNMPSFTYSAATCSAKCKSQFFFDHCGCSPSAYDVEDKYPVCSPLHVVNCIDKHMLVNNGTDFALPHCPECKIECNSNIYQTFNSYGQEFSVSSLRWLNKKNSSWSPELIKKNFLTINVFFRDLSHTEYKQVQATSLTELFSNIGGNMGMFLGMSTITITEITLFLCKMFWIAFSKQRRSYMAEKKKREEDQDKEVEETVKEFKRIRSCQDLSSFNCKPMMEHYLNEPAFKIAVPQLSIESCNSSDNGAETESTEMTERWKDTPSPR